MSHHATAKTNPSSRRKPRPMEDRCILDASPATPPTPSVEQSSQACTNLTNLMTRTRRVRTGISLAEHTTQMPHPEEREGEPWYPLPRYTLERPPKVRSSVLSYMPPDQTVRHPMKVTQCIDCGSAHEHVVYNICKKCLLIVHHLRVVRTRRGHGLGIQAYWSGHTRENNDPVFRPGQWVAEYCAEVDLSAKEHPNPSFGTEFLCELALLDTQTGDGYSHSELTEDHRELIAETNRQTPGRYLYATQNGALTRGAGSICNSEHRKKVVSNAEIVTGDLVNHRRRLGVAVRRTAKEGIFHMDEILVVYAARAESGSYDVTRNTGTTLLRGRPIMQSADYPWDDELESEDAAALSKELMAAEVLMEQLLNEGQQATECRGAARPPSNSKKTRLTKSNRTTEGTKKIEAFFKPKSPEGDNR